MDEICDRCRRPAPPRTTLDYIDWEAATKADGTVAIICPGCVTDEEMDELFADSVEIVDRMASCSRCGAERPDDEPDGPRQWILLDELICGSCATVADRQKNLRELQHEAAVLCETARGRGFRGHS